MRPLDPLRVPLRWGGGSAAPAHWRLGIAGPRPGRAGLAPSRKLEGFGPVARGHFAPARSPRALVSDLSPQPRGARAALPVPWPPPGVRGLAASCAGHRSRAGVEGLALILESAAARRRGAGGQAGGERPGEVAPRRTPGRPAGPGRAAPAYRAAEWCPLVSLPGPDRAPRAPAGHSLGRLGISHGTHGRAGCQDLTQGGVASGHTAGGGHRRAPGARRAPESRPRPRCAPVPRGCQDSELGEGAFEEG